MCIRFISMETRSIDLYVMYYIKASNSSVSKMLPLESMDVRPTATEMIQEVGDAIPRRGWRTHQKDHGTFEMLLLSFSPSFGNYPLLVLSVKWNNNDDEISPLMSDDASDFDKRRWSGDGLADGRHQRKYDVIVILILLCNVDVFIVFRIKIDTKSRPVNSV